EERAVVGGGLTGDLLDPLPLELLAEFEDRAGGGLHRPQPAGAPPLARHPHADLTGFLGHVDGAHPLDDALVLLVDDLFRPARRHQPASRPGPSLVAGCPGASVGNRKSDRRARSTMARPIKVGAPAPD